MRYFLFIDESGDHDLKNINPKFPVLTVCGILISEYNYKILDTKLKEFKKSVFGDESIVLHSSEIRKQVNAFYGLQHKIQQFYDGFNEVIASNHFRIISATIRKEKYKDKYNSPFSGPYQQAITFILERCVFSLDEVYSRDPKLKIIIESRGGKEDIKLGEHISKIKTNGTFYVDVNRFDKFEFKYDFLKKSYNVNGLQLADMIAYPIARYVNDGYTSSIPFNILEPKIYQHPTNRSQTKWGLKIFP